MRRWMIEISIVGMALVLAACDGSSAAPPTGRPIVPTRVIPTIIDTATPTPTSTSTFTPTPTATFTIAASATMSATSSDTATLVPATDTSTVTATPSMTDTAAPTPTETPQASTPLTFELTTAYRAPSLMREIVLGDAISGEITRRLSALVYPFVGDVDQFIDITMTSSDDTLDPLVIVLTSKGQEIARNDDETPENRNSVLRGVRLPENDTYYIVATRYLGRYGNSEGAFTLSLDESNGLEAEIGFLSIPLVFDKIMVGYLDEDISEEIYTFRARAGDVVSIDMRRSNEDDTLNPTIAITDNLGNLLIANDDSETTSFDAYIDEFVLPRDGYYSVIAARYITGDSTISGDYELEITLISRGGKSGVYPLDAQINPQNSRTIRSDRRLFTSFVAGDVITEGGDEMRLQSLITYEIPPDLTAEDVESAALTLELCEGFGGGFEELGELTVYLDPFGTMDTDRDVLRPTVGSRVLTVLTDCDTIDITDQVIAALEINEYTLQFRLTFRAAENNGQSDQIRFIDPRLLIYLQP